MIKTDENGFIICPNCGRKTRVKIACDTKIYRFPLYCGFCKRESYISNTE